MHAPQTSHAVIHQSVPAHPAAVGAISFGGCREIIANIPVVLASFLQKLPSYVNSFAADQQMQLDTRLSYGLLTFATQGLLTPYSEVTFGATNSYRLGIHWQGNNRLDLHLFGEHRESHSRQDDQAIMLKGTLHF